MTSPPSVPVKPGWPAIGFVLPSATVASRSGLLKVYAERGMTCHLAGAVLDVAAVEAELGRHVVVERQLAGQACPSGCVITGLMIESREEKSCALPSHWPRSGAGANAAVPRTPLRQRGVGPPAGPVGAGEHDALGPAPPAEAVLEALREDRPRPGARPAQRRRVLAGTSAGSCTGSARAAAHGRRDRAVTDVQSAARDRRDDVAAGPGCRRHRGDPVADLVARTRRREQSAKSAKSEVGVR